MRVCTLRACLCACVGDLWYIITIWWWWYVGFHKRLPFFLGLLWNIKHKADALFIRKRRSVRLRSYVCEKLVTVYFHTSLSILCFATSNNYIYGITNITPNDFTPVVTINPQITEVWSRRNAPHDVCSLCCVNPLSRRAAVAMEVWHFPAFSGAPELSGGKRSVSCVRVCANARNSGGWFELRDCVGLLWVVSNRSLSCVAALDNGFPATHN